MPKYRVDVSRIAYSNMEIIVDAKNPKQAMKKAQEEAPNHLFPSEHTSEYEAQGAILIKETTPEA